MPTALIGAAITGGASLIGGLFGGPKKTTVQQPTFSPDQLALQSKVGSTLSDRLSNPTSLDPEKVAAMSSVNKTFKGATSSLESSLAGKGFGSSGKLATGDQSLAIGRAGAMGSLESSFAGMQLDQNNKTLDDAQKFAFSSPGGTSTSQQSGGVGGAVAGGTETATLLYALNHLMGGGSPAGMDEAGPAGTPTFNPATGGHF